MHDLKVECQMAIDLIHLDDQLAEIPSWLTDTTMDK